MRGIFTRLAVASFAIGFGHGFFGCSSSEEVPPVAEEAIQTSDEEEVAEAGPASDTPILSQLPAGDIDAVDAVASPAVTEDSAPAPAPNSDDDFETVEGPAAGSSSVAEKKEEEAEVDLAAETTEQAPSSVAAAIPDMRAPEVDQAVEAEDVSEVAKVVSYVIKAGDTVSRIAKKIYGSEGHWKEIAAASGLSDPNRIFPGNVLKIPLSNVQAKHYSEGHVGVPKSVSNKGFYVVKVGDTLSSIAQENFHDAGLWSKLYEQNRDSIKNPDVLIVGQEISLGGNRTH